VFKYGFTFSGDFDIRVFLQDHYDDQVYFNNPVDYVPSMGGTWQAVMRGFAGLRKGTVSVEVHPRLPEAWHRLRTQVLYHKRWYELDVTRDRAVARPVGPRP